MGMTHTTKRLVTEQVIEMLLCHEAFEVAANVSSDALLPERSLWTLNAACCRDTVDHTSESTTTNFMALDFTSSVTFIDKEMFIV